MDSRTPEQIREHYIVEKELATRLKSAPRELRRKLYSEVYDELFRRLPHHPQLSRKISAKESQANVDYQMKVLGRFLKPGTRYMEIGPGDCSLAIAAADRVEQVLAVDVSGEITRASAFPANLTLVLTDGTAIPVAAASVDVAYSSDLIEHLHSEDALEQTRGIFAALAPGGIYVCVTPNRLGGPWDASRSFSRTAEGFHLREYSISELARMFRKCGFRRVGVLLGVRGRFILVRAGLVALAERAVSLLPHTWRKTAAQRFLWAGYIRMVAQKSRN